MRAGVSYGLEFPKYFSTGEADREEEYTFRRSNAFDTVAGEVAAVRENVGEQPQDSRVISPSEPAAKHASSC